MITQLIAALWLAAAAPCLPPGVPALDTMQVTGTGAREITDAGTAHTYPVRAWLYEDAAGHRFLIYGFVGAVAIVDDHPDDPADYNWWLDEAMVTDETPPRAQREPHPSCVWRRRRSGDT